MGERSDGFHHAVGWAKDHGLTQSQVEAEFRRHPDGIAAKYLKPRDRLAREIARCWPKLANHDTRRLERTNAGDLYDAETGEIVGLAAAVPAVPVNASIDDRDFPDADLIVPGLVGRMADWIMATSPKPVRLFATAAALVTVGTLIGRRVYCGTPRTGSHLYLMTIAGTGAGKERPQEAVRQILDAVSSHRLHTAEPSSAAALSLRLAERPVQVQICDEVDRILRKVSHKMASSQEAELLQVYCTLWGRSTGTFIPTSVTTRGDILIKRPSLSFYGATTFSAFYEHLKAKMLAGGFLNRFLVLPRFERVAFNTSIKSDDEVPPDLVRSGRTLFGFQDVPPPGSDVSKFLPSTAMLLDPERPPPLATIDVSKRAQEALQSIQDHQEAMQRASDEDPYMEAWSREAELTKRIALIVACGRFADVGLTGVMVDEADVSFASRLVRWSLDGFVTGLRHNLVENEHQGHAKKVLAYVRKAKGAAVTRSQIYRHMDDCLRSRELEGILDQLCAGGQVERLGEETGGRPKVLYRILES